MDGSQAAEVVEQLPAAAPMAVRRKLYWSDPATTGTAVEEASDGFSPGGFALEQNYPNPARAVP